VRIEGRPLRVLRYRCVATRFRWAQPGQRLWLCF